MKKELLVTNMNATIVSGRGLASKRIEKLEDPLKGLGYNIYKGSLNSVLKKPILLNKEKAILNVENRWYFWNIKVNGVRCLAYRYSMCPFHIVEIVSENKLRSQFHLEERDTIQIEIKTELLKELTRFQLLLWNIAWKGREMLFYTSNRYPKFIGKFLNLRHRIYTNN